MNPKNIHRIVIAVLAILFYGNTLTLHYALDDRMVIVESKPTIKADWESVKEIFTEDNFSGFFGKDQSIVAGGRYRPLSQFTFLVETRLFGSKIKDKIGDLDDYDNLHNSAHEAYFYDTPLPFVNHLMNLVYFIILCLLLYEVLSKIFPTYTSVKWYQSLPFIAVVLFAVHPIHTEVVANVKGRDELLAMLGAVASLSVTLKFIDTRKWYYLLLSAIFFTIGVFSKENAITFLAVLPLAVYYYKSDKKRGSDYILTMVPAMVASVFFMAARSKVLGGLMPPDTTQNILNNPFVNATGAQRVATVLLTWGIYLKLLFIPHPLTHDYYPYQIQLTDFSNPVVLIVLLIVVAVLIYAVIKLKSRSVVSFSIIYFVITFSITSNLLFNVGTFMNERFVFMSSIGFTLLVAYWLYLLAISKQALYQKISLGLFMVVALLFGIKTFTRNFVWKDDFTLFTTDVETSSNSIKCNVSAGGSYLQEWKSTHREKDKRKAYGYLEKALQLDPYSLNAYMLLSELAYLDNNPDVSRNAAYNATQLDPANETAKALLRQAEFGQQRKEVDDVRELLNDGKAEEAWDRINKFLKTHPDDIYGLNMKGNVAGRGFGRVDEAIGIFEDIVKRDSTFSSAWENMGICYAIKRDFGNAERCFKKALELSPDNENVKENLRKMYSDRDK